jgi:hypothetical protein
VADRLLVASWSAACQKGKHAGCLGRMPDGRNLLVCPCTCHDAGEGISLRDVMSKLGRAGGLKGGRARAASLSPARRTEIALKAARARWGNRGPA